jgi:hypothetical protein
MLHSTARSPLRTGTDSCTGNRFDLEQHGIKFEDHFLAHNPLHYIMYVVYLTQTDPDEHNGTEQYVASCLTDKKFEWLPLLKCTEMLKRAEDPVWTELRQDFLKPIKAELAILSSRLAKLEQQNDPSLTNAR